jgi:Ca2+-transporting ATPase
MSKTEKTPQQPAESKASADNPDARFHARPSQEVLEALEVELEKGLTEQTARARRKQYGRNRLKQVQRRSAWTILIDQFKSIVLLVLAVAGAIAFALGEWIEALAIAAVLLVNGIIGFVSEWRATRSMEALQKLGQAHTRVRRDGREKEIPADALVPGDIVLIEGGDVVPADLRLIEANNLQVNEAALTGESVPVNKRVGALEGDPALAERTNLLFKGTTLTQGSGQGVVIATGMATELGQIAELAEAAEEQATPLEKRLDALGRRLAWITLLIAAAVAGVGLLAGQPVRIMIETAIALGVAAVPEGLPIVATLALARGMWLMAKRQALINRLAAVETLGATRVIFTDKTGTLTENRMRLRRVVTPTGDFDLEAGETSADDLALRQVLEVGVLCNNATLDNDTTDGEEALGDPTEVALLQGGARFNLTRRKLLERRPEAREVAFDTDVMMMATFHEVEGGGYQVAVKGAPKAVLEVCGSQVDREDDKPLDEETRQEWLERSEALASDGLRVLAIADKRTDSTDAEPYEKLRFLGLVGLLDPPAKGVREAIDACRSAGIRVVMVTGDQPATARAIGYQVGLTDDENVPAHHGSELKEPDQLSAEERRRLLETRIFARVNPEQKLHMVKLYQEQGETVAMTGDGVNDTPALKQADIGVAMGIRGTDAAREAADMVLKDDRFSSIVEALRHGRIIFENIRMSVLFMLCTNVAEIIAVATASAVGAPLPLRALQILYLNVVTDVFPALALGVGEGDERVMRRPPRDPKEPVLTLRHWLVIVGWGFFIAACVLSALTLALQCLGLSEPAAVTVSFLTLAFAKLWFVFNLRDRTSTPWRNAVVRNYVIWAAISLCIPLLLLAVYLPGLAEVLSTEPPGLAGWGLIMAMSVVPFIVGQIILTVLRCRERRSGSERAEAVTG